MRLVVILFIMFFLANISGLAEQTDYIGGYIGAGVGATRLDSPFYTSGGFLDIAIDGWGPFGRTSIFGFRGSADIIFIESEVVGQMLIDVGLNFPSK